MNIQRTIIQTKDGSATIFIPEWNEHYHSVHGAIQEAYHVFIENGLKHTDQLNINVLEIGFGTGLNALLTYFEGKKLGKTVYYCGLEGFPISENEFNLLNYSELLNYSDAQSVFATMFHSKWDEKTSIYSHFDLYKKRVLFENFNSEPIFNLIYFDAFGARVQPELWTEFIFEKMYNALTNNGILVTYSAKGSVRRAMQSVGFVVERLPGPPGKREMLRGIKK